MPEDLATMHEVTALLNDMASGSVEAGERLYTLLYPELKRLARSHLSGSGPTTLDPSALIHEVWLRSRGQQTPAHRGQFFALASVVMRSVIVDHVRRRAAAKRGGGLAVVTLSTGEMESVPAPPDVLGIEDALETLARVDERAHKVVELRFYGGMQLEEIAQVLDVSVPTIKRDWRRARAYLFKQLSE
jgi:RNA polymerase sigma factor (TIGR02999 family)